MPNASLADTSLTTQTAAIDRQALLDMIYKKFPYIDAHHVALLKQATAIQLLAWTNQLSTTDDLVSILGKIPNPNAELLIKLLTDKFTQVPETYLQRIHTADQVILAKWRTRYFKGKSLEQIFSKVTLADILQILGIIIKMSPLFVLVLIFRTLPALSDPVSLIELSLEFGLAVLLAIFGSMIALLVFSVFELSDK